MGAMGHPGGVGISFILSFGVDYPFKPPTINFFTKDEERINLHPGVCNKTFELSNVALERAPWHPLHGVDACIDYVEQQFEALGNPDTVLRDFHMMGRQSPSSSIYIMN